MSNYPEHLDNWYCVPESPSEKEWVVAHYVRGEDYVEVDSYVGSREEAEARRDYLNCLDLVYTYGVYPIMPYSEFLEKTGGA